MRARLITLSIAAMIATAPAAMAERAIVSETGTVYAQTPSDTLTRLEAASETITLTDSCTAKIPGRGVGSWAWTPEGTRVTVGTYRVSFSDVPLVSVVRCAG